MDPQQTTFKAPFTWNQWWRLGRQDTLAHFNAYSQEVIADLYALKAQAGPTPAQETEVRARRAALLALTKAPAVAPGQHQPPTPAMVAAMDALHAALLEAIHPSIAEKADYAVAQDKWSPLNRSVIKQPEDTDLLLASGGVGWKDAWATDPIPVDINSPAVTEEIRALCAFVLCSDSVVGVVIPGDERGDRPVPGGEQAYAGSLVADTRPPGLRRTFECQHFGTMRSWHVDLPGFLVGKRGAAVDGDRRTAYRTLNQQEFDRGEGIAVPVAEITNTPGRVLKRDGRPVAQGLTEFNVLFGTQGRLIFDYDAGAFYLSGHYQGYPVPDAALTEAERKSNDARKARKETGYVCFPYFVLTNLGALRLSWAGFKELGRLRYWENKRRNRCSATIG